MLIIGEKDGVGVLNDTGSGAIVRVDMSVTGKLKEYLIVRPMV